MEKIAVLEERMTALESNLQASISGLEAALRDSTVAIQERTAGLQASVQDRMTALETALQKCPGEACLFCGERSLRLKKASGLIGAGRGTWRRETWVCEACGKEDWRQRNYPD
jgi:Tfp pilus assembly protein PilX